jgi:hypothetical protein
MATIATKLQTGTAALAIIAAATLVPAAQAAPYISAPTAPVTQVLQELNLGPAALPEINFFWFSTPNPNPAPRVTIFNPAFPILGPISRILDPVWALLGLRGKELCLLGADIEFGAYGGFTVRLGVGC